MHSEVRRFAAVSALVRVGSTPALAAEQPPVLGLKPVDVAQHVSLIPNPSLARRSRGRRYPAELELAQRPRGRIRRRRAANRPARPAKPLIANDGSGVRRAGSRAAKQTVPALRRAVLLRYRHGCEVLGCSNARWLDAGFVRGADSGGPAAWAKLTRREQQQEARPPAPW
jgi:hypothetical protein